MSHLIETDKLNENSDEALKPLPDLPILIAAAEVPKYIGMKVQTLARWRHEGFGPPHIHLGRRIFYRSSDLQNWIESQKRQNTLDVK
tara:strand:- start:59 stop:319 length:261 start_codon:yes stop_codon:yes gene_type:complete